MYEHRFYKHFNVWRRHIFKLYNSHIVSYLKLKLKYKFWQQDYFKESLGKISSFNTNINTYVEVHLKLNKSHTKKSKSEARTHKQFDRPNEQESK